MIQGGGGGRKDTEGILETLEVHLAKNEVH